jgi:hypothetical protein
MKARFAIPMLVAGDGSRARTMVVRVMIFVTVGISELGSFRSFFVLAAGTRLRDRRWSHDSSLSLQLPNRSWVRFAVNTTSAGADSQTPGSRSPWTDSVPRVPDSVWTRWEIIDE